MIMNCRLPSCPTSPNCVSIQTQNEDRPITPFSR